MTVRSSLLFAVRLLFPRTAKDSSARKSLAGALLCIGISLVPLVVVLAVTNGMIEGMTERMIGLSSSHLEALVMRSAEEVSTPEKFRNFTRKIARTDGITSAYSEITSSVLAAGSSYRTGAQVRAVDPAVFSENKSYRTMLKVKEGNLDSFLSGTKNAVVGQKLASLLNLHEGSVFRIISAQTSPAGIIVPKAAAFKVAAVVSSGYEELDALWVFIPLDTAYTALSLKNCRFSIHLETSDAFSPDIVRIQNACTESAEGLANVYRWDEMDRAQYENFSSTKVMLVFIMILIVLVASVNISSALVMLVMERRREIAILKSFGATPGGVALSFIITGMAAGCGGVLLGVPAGLLCAVNVNGIISFFEKIVNGAAEFVYLLSGRSASDFTGIHLMDPAYYLESVPVSIPFRDLFIITAAALLLSLAVSVIPAYKAGKEKPLETLRKV